MNLKRFFQWLTLQPGYKSRLKYSDAEYSPVKTSVLPPPDVSNAHRRNRALIVFHSSYGGYCQTGRCSWVQL